MSGMNESDRLKQHGVMARKASVTRPPIHQLTLVRTGPTAHPRADFLPDESLVKWIMANGMRAITGEPWKFVVREMGVDPTTGVMGLEIGNGSRRQNAGLEAERRLRATKPRARPLVWDKADPNDLGRLYVDIELFVGTDAEFLRMRLAANSEPGKLDDSTFVLAVTVKQLHDVGDDDIDAIVAVMPRGVGKKEVQALARFDNLVPAVKARWIAEDLPVGLLAAVLDAPRDKQMETLDLLLAKGITSSKGATRTLNTKREETTGAPRPRKFTPKKLKAIAKMVAPAMGVQVCFDSEEANFSEREMEIFKGGFAAAANLFAGQKTGALPAEITTIIKEVAKGLPGKGKAKAEPKPADAE